MSIDMFIGWIVGAVMGAAIVALRFTSGAHGDQTGEIG